MLKTLIERKIGIKSWLIPELETLYGGELAFPEPPAHRPFVVANFVQTIDGIVSFSDVPGHIGGGDISAFNPSDRFVMALLRTLADAVLVGANTLRLEPEHEWTPEFLEPERVDLWQKQREARGQPGSYINAFLTRSGNLPREAPVFHNPKIKTVELQSQGSITTGREFLALQDLRQKHDVKLLLVEGGPSVFGALMALNLIDEIFLTVAPQIAGNKMSANRPTLVQEALFTPDTAPWWEIVSEKMADGDRSMDSNYRLFRYRNLHRRRSLVP